MFATKTLNVSHFDNLNVINFLKRFLNLCDKHKIINVYKIIKLSRYCNKLIENFVKSSFY